jgi:hypothetical protein
MIPAFSPKAERHQSVMPPRPEEFGDNIVLVLFV